MRLLSICLISSLITFSACSTTEREEAVYLLIQEGARLAEAHDIGGMMDLAMDDFTADPGGHSRKETRRILFVMLNRYGNFRILYPQPSVKLSEDEQSAIVKMNFLIAQKGQSLPQLELLYKDPPAWLAMVDKSADLYTLSMELRYVSGNWLLQKARITTFARPHGQL